MECGHIKSGNYCPICQTGKAEKKKPKPIKRVSKKRIVKNKEYSEIRKEYLKVFPVCEVENCTNKSIEIHHKSGKIGDLLTNINNFLAVCRKCHQKIELNPIFAKEQGYSKTRL